MSTNALIEKIMKTARDEAEQITNDIMLRAAEDEKLSLQKADEECAAIYKAAEEKCAQIKRTAELTSGLSGRKARLHAHRELLDEAFCAAYDKIKNADGDFRLSFIKKLIVKYAPAADMTAKVSDNDLDAVTAAKAEREAALTEKFGGKASVKLEADKKINGGVYMVSPLCDVDCTLESVFDELREKYEAEADGIMFSVTQG